MKEEKEEEGVERGRCVYMCGRRYPNCKKVIQIVKNKTKDLFYFLASFR